MTISLKPVSAGKWSPQALARAVKDATAEPELTKWYGPEFVPGQVGEYNASCFKTGSIRRWWDGKRWSRCYIAESTPNYEPALQTEQDAMWFRGLAEEPK